MAARYTYFNLLPPQVSQLKPGLNKLNFAKPKSAAQAVVSPSSKRSESKRICLTDSDIVIYSMFVIQS
jgi:hypothetical protein